MSERTIAPGDKLHIMTRRLFPDDLRRHFAGEVISTTDGLCELQGNTFVFHPATNKYQRRTQLRTRIFSLADANHIVNKLPRDVDIKSLEYRTVDERLVVTDMKSFSLDVNEFGPAS